AARILRRGGKLVAIHEPCIADHITPEQDAPNIARETAYHIQELRPKLDDYRRALQHAGLRELALFHHETYGATVEKLQAWSKKHDLPPLTEQQMRDLQRNQRFGLRHITRTIQSRFKQRPDPALLPPQAWMDQFYRRCGGNLTLISERL
ncbi:MAG: methyltransferase type 11, partial [Chloroflexus sp.]